MAQRWASRLCAVLAAVGLLAASPVAAPIRLQATRPVSRTIAAFPRIVSGPHDATAARINRALAQADQQPGCDGQKGTWNRSIAVTMRGPRYLSLLAQDDWYCGGAYPDTDSVPLVYDLQSGAPINWQAIIPPALFEKAGTSPGGTAADPIEVSSDGLWKLYAKAATAALNDSDCAQVLADPSGSGTGLMLWPDAADDGLAVQQADFPHVIKACGPPITITSAELRKLGFAADFVSAIDEAHQRGWFDRARK